MATAYVTGIAETEVGRLEGRSALDLMGQAAHAAMADAGLAPKQIGAVITGRSMVAPLHRVANILATQLGLPAATAMTLEAGGATSLQMLGTAAALVAARRAEHVLCAIADNLLTGMTRDGAVAALAANAHPQFEVPLGTFPPAAYALVAQAYLAKHKLDRRVLAEVAVSARAWAGQNPTAQHREPITVDDVLAAKRVAEPFGLLDCAPVSDGGGAFVVSATPGKVRDAQVELLGFGEGRTHEYISGAPDLEQFGSAVSGPAALQAAGITPGDLDFAELYDCFTITPIVVAEHIGLCPPGGGADYFAGGRTGPGGEFPVNTHGGLLSHAHPGKPGGIFHLTEAVRQLRGDAGDRQVEGAELGLVHGVGGMFSVHATAVLRRTA